MCIRDRLIILGGLEGVDRLTAKAEPNRLETDDVGRGDVAEVDVGTDSTHEVALQLHRGRLKEQLVDTEATDENLLDQAKPQFAVRSTDAAVSTFAGFERDEHGAGVEVVLDGGDPLIGCHVLGLHGVLGTDFGNDVKVVTQLRDVGRLLDVTQVDRAVGHLDVVRTVVLTHRTELFESILHEVLLEQGAAEIELDARTAKHLNLRLHLRVHHRGSPSEFHEVDEVTRTRHDVGEVRQRHTVVDHHGDAVLTRLGGAIGQIQVIDAHRVHYLSCQSMRDHQLSQPASTFGIQTLPMPL